MNSINYTTHARQRLRQRGRREQDVSLIMQYGTAMKGGGIMLHEQDVSRAIRELKTLSRVTAAVVELEGDISRRSGRHDIQQKGFTRVGYLAIERRYQ